MNATSETHLYPDLVDVAGPQNHGQAATATLAKAEAYARAAQRMRRGKQLVISGFVVAVVGMVGYCVACLSAGINQDVGAYFMENPGPLIGPTLGIIGMGTLLWLVGSFVYLSAAMDSDPDGPDIHF